MTTPTVLVSTWEDGVFSLASERPVQELAGEAVTALAPHGHGGAIAIVAGRELRRRAGGGWSTLATAEGGLACCVAIGEEIYVGTDDARVLRLGATGQLIALGGLDAVEGRERWYGGQALVDGRWVGPPLGVRSITVTADGGALLANIHVGGIPRSIDGGQTWRSTIDLESDVHEVRAHPERRDLVMAAAAAGLCISRDGGFTWTIERGGLAAAHQHGSALAFAGDDVLLAASESPFATTGALYRRPLDGDGPLSLAGGGLPDTLDGIVDTRCIASRGGAVAFATARGSVYRSDDAGRSWSPGSRGLPFPSGVVMV
jgi:hypothetical protein